METNSTEYIKIAAADDDASMMKNLNKSKGAISGSPDQINIKSSAYKFKNIEKLKLEGSKTISPLKKSKARRNNPKSLLYQQPSEPFQLSTQEIKT